MRISEQVKMLSAHYNQHLMRLLGIIIIYAFGLGGCGGSSSDPIPPSDGATEPPVHNQNIIKPSSFSQQQLDLDLLNFYTAWKSVYLIQGCGEGRYYVGVSADGKAVGGGTVESTITVSEAHGYGMLISVMMADFDSDAKKIFDGMVHYFHDHPATSDPGLMAWDQIEGCGNAGDEAGGGSSATDGDLDIAYALLLADTQWGSNGEIDYKEEALKVIAAVKEHEINSDSQFVRIGDWVDDVDNGQYANITRSSDFMTSHFNAFANATGDNSWHAVRDETYSIIESIHNTYSTGTALLPDFIVDLPLNPRPSDTNFIEGPNDGLYSWNAARYPWRITLDFLLNDDLRAFNAIEPLNSWIKRATGEDPTKIADTYNLDGTPTTESGYDEMVFVSMFAVSATVDGINQQWLDALWQNIISKNVSDEDYYGNTLKLLSMLTITGHWAHP